MSEASAQHAHPAMGDDTGIRLVGWATAPSPWPERWIWVCAVAMLLALHSHSWMVIAGFDDETGREVAADIVHPVRRLVFTVAFFGLLVPLFADARRAWIATPGLVGERFRWGKEALLMLCGLSLLIFPLAYEDFVRGEYVRMVESPLTFTRSLEHLRVLRPYLAALMQLHGPFLYLVQSLALTAALILATIRYLNVGTGKRLFMTVCFSVCTSSFILYDLDRPGGCDPLVFAFIFIAVLVPLSTTSWVALMTLSLATHQMTIFTLMPLAFVLAPIRLGVRGVCLSVLYVLLWVPALVGDYGSHSNHWPMINKLTSSWSDIGFGAWFAFKLLWLAIPAAWWLRRRVIGWVQPAAALLLILVPMGPMILLRPIPDSSRIMAFGFIGMLYFVRQLLLALRDRPRLAPWVGTLAVINIALPYSFLIGWTMTMRPMYGLYAMLWQLIDK